MKLKQWLPWIIVAVFAVWLIGALRTPPDQTWALGEFGRIPVVYNGRVQPIDSLGRNALLQLRGKQSANLEPWKEWHQKPKIISATEWILGVMTKPQEADGWPVFRIDNPDVKGLLKLPDEPDLAKQLDGKHFSWLQIQPNLGELERESARANKVEAAARTPYDQALLKLREGLQLYDHLQYTLGPAASGELLADIGPYMQKVEAGRAAYLAADQKQQFDRDAYMWFINQLEAPLVVAAGKGGTPEQWLRAVDAVMQGAGSGGRPHYSLLAFNEISHAYHANDVAGFNRATTGYLQSLSNQAFKPELKKARSEQFFSQIEPFYKAMELYVLAFLLVLTYWFRPVQWDWLRVSALLLVGLALVVHTFGLIFRMWLEGRPPVTNLYSSAIFIGWGAVALGLVLEGTWKNSIGVMVSCIIGFTTLIIAHHLSLSGDTMEMMRAVLDTNFWLATHVVVVTLGYASTFVAGILATLYIFMGVFTRALNAEMARSLNRMIYGIICFATLFSFVGTVLGGIWADQSWGRFWGWDPKENGALIIVLWNALILHARWGGLVKERGLANLAIVGNIVTSWSWFGVNMLGIGLHAYGFTSAAFRWLMIFVASQLVLIGLGMLPKTAWLSFRDAAAAPAKSRKQKPLAAAG